MAREASRPPFLCSWVCQIEMKEGCQPRVSMWPLASWGHPLPLHGAQGKNDKRRLGRVIRSGRCLFFFVEFLGRVKQIDETNISSFSHVLNHIGIGSEADIFIFAVW